MDYREIVSVTGIGGLFQLIATKSDGAIVRNLGDKATKFIPARLHNVTPLESIEVYTTGENVRLHEVFEKMKENESIALPDSKKADNDTVKKYFKQIFPEFDDERVYVSDMKKMVKWFEILKKNDLLSFEFYKQQDETAAEDEKEVSDHSEEQTEPISASAEKPVKKSGSKNELTEDEVTEEKVKKTVKKKKIAEDASGEEEKPAKKTAKKKSAE